MNVPSFKDALAEANTVERMKALDEAVKQGVSDIDQTPGRGVFDRKCLGLLLCEAGNLSDHILGESRKKFMEVIKEALANAANDDPTMVWAPNDGETMAAFLPDANMTKLPQMTHVNMPSVHGWRVVDRFVIQGAPEHGSPTLLVYNQHQPSSKERPWPNPLRINCCRYILIDAMNYCSRDSYCVGFVFGGDANCGIAHWNPAILEVRPWKHTFATLSYIQGIHRKPGDFLVAGSVKYADFIVYENTCLVQGREKQHDPMVFKFSFKPRARVQARVEEPANGGELASGAEEQAAAPDPMIPSHDSWTDQHNIATIADRFVSDKVEEDLISEPDYGGDADEDGGAPDAQDAPHAAEEAQPEEAEHFDELGCIGLALAQSLSVLGDMKTGVCLT